jgi:hypothetical protein
MSHAWVPKGTSAKSVGSFVPRLTQKAFEKFGFPAAAILTDWPAIVGADLATFSEPESLKWPRAAQPVADADTPAPDDRPRRGAKAADGPAAAALVLRVEGGRALEIQFKTRQIIDRINAYFGFRAVAELRILQAPLTRTGQPKKTAARAAPATEPVIDVPATADPALQDVLKRLGRNVAITKR